MDTILSYLPAGLGPEDVVAAMAAAAALLGLAAVWNGFLVRDPLARRARSWKAARNRARADLLAPGGHRTRRLASATGTFRRIAHRLKLFRSSQAQAIQLKLARAGWRSKDALAVFLVMKAGLPLALGASAALVLFMPGLGAAGLDAPIKGLIALLAVGVGYYAPEITVANAVAKRRDAIRKGLPDALDLLVICTEAGLTLDAALSRLAGEIGRSCPQLADECALTAVELGFLPERRTALENLSKRVDLEPVRGVVNALMQTEKYGTPLAQSLRVLANEFRTERMLKAEEKAARLPATLTVPLVLFILPSLFVVLLGPAVLDTFDKLGGM